MSPSTARAQIEALIQNAQEQMVDSTESMWHAMEKAQGGGLDELTSLKALPEYKATLAAFKAIEKAAVAEKDADTAAAVAAMECRHLQL